ncbi:DNA-binding response regulator, OmpR family, contains REC and winged-helix (wHTH) domain [Butyrivibrio sp. YAB3001]|nr:DNA-binding response regulator, OmpR family, contains REC and winged-helix (wHTH) domain [Butyrivibrio sp. YAB3001]
MHYNCLIVDDEIELAKMTAEYFRMFDVLTMYVDSAAACYSFFDEGDTADMVLLDINLGDGTGFEVCKKLREDMQLPILFISARQSDDDVLIALSIGGDDYIKKPYSLSVLLAKVKVNLKRIEQMKNAANLFDTPANNNAKSADEGFSMNYSTMSVVIDGRSIPLKAKEYALLDCLYKHHDTIVKKEVLFDEVWGDTFFSDSTLNVHIRKLREKIEENPNDPKFIKTVWGTGYILELS